MNPASDSSRDLEQRFDFTGLKGHLVDSACTCAAHMKTKLESMNLLRTAKAKPTLEIHLTDLSEQFENLARQFLNADFGKVKHARVS